MSVGERIRSARMERGLSQTAMAEAGGVTRFAQGKFESGLNLPGGAYWLGLHAAGFDIAYLLTGLAGARDAVESEVLLRYRAADDAGKKRIRQASAAQSEPVVMGKKRAFKGG